MIAKLWGDIVLLWHTSEVVPYEYASFLSLRLSPVIKLLF